ncbi:hypothetical protein J2T57_002793 [Natronocella acetinitrilica]|uniref:Uncharacterized protein n=1 Tax=Natronocella acetinitrilica TaxID=414046 RepID=A0AAE3G782_9GAMM|nr:hypothetical protein [Natronocella acetinitrilica]MCP1675643.1 hypothetical protein [Natronocella acetinitrilica]
MIGNQDRSKKQLARLGSTLARDVDELSDEDLLQEYDNPVAAAAETRSLINAVVSAHSKQRLQAARRGYDALASKTTLSVVELSPEQKWALIERFSSDDPALREKLTMAARNQDDHGADIDTYLQDLVELGVIDEEGNLL